MEERLQLWEDGSRLTAAGEVDAATADELDAALGRCLAGTPDGDVVIDLSGVTFIDSLGLRVLVRVHRSLAERGDALLLQQPSAPVERALDYAGLREHLHVAVAGDPDAGPVGEDAAGETR